MKYRKALALVTLLASSLAVTLAMAGPIHTRQKEQRTRIKQGHNTGSLTHHERKVLNAEQQVINNTRDRALSDGAMSAKEARKLTRMQNKASRDIYRLKHNRRTKP
jgi:hypothetical protein